MIVGEGVPRQFKGAETCFSKMMLRKLDALIQKQKGGEKKKRSPYFTLHTKINTKGMEDLNVRVKTIQVLEENMGVALPDLGPCSGC